MTNATVPYRSGHLLRKAEDDVGCLSCCAGYVGVVDLPRHVEVKKTIGLGNLYRGVALIPAEYWHSASIV